MTIPLIIMLFIAGMSSAVWAGECWKIQDADTKAWCEATTEGKRSCWKIRNKDRKAYCESLVEGKKHCWKIADKDLATMCKAQTRQ